MTNEQIRVAVADWLGNLMATVGTDDERVPGYTDVVQAMQDDEEALFMQFDEARGVGAPTDAEHGRRYYAIAEWIENLSPQVWKAMPKAERAFANEIVEGWHMAQADASVFSQGGDS